jgi:hypothetical protein
MSYANQPTRLLISSDDLEFGQGNNFSISLPEAITGATSVDLIRAVIPNTGYSIPDYQNTFYFNLQTPGTAAIVSYAIVLPNQQWFDGIANQAGTSPVYNNPLLPVLQAAITAQTPNVSVSWTGYNTQPTQRITITGLNSYTVRVLRSSEWPTRFALNTRLGFQGSTTFTASATGTILPNLIRSKVVYVLCNVVLNDSISTDGLRTAIAKVPVNSSYGGLSIYSPPVLNYNKLVPSTSYQNINVQLIDDQYQAYPLQTEEFCELELVFRYDGSKDPKSFSY